MWRKASVAVELLGQLFARRHALSQEVSKQYRSTKAEKA